MNRSAPRPSRIWPARRRARCSLLRPESPMSPSGPIEPAMKTSRPETSRASRASFTADELIRSNSSSRKCCASLRRFAPKVFVSISSAPARMKETCSETTASGARRFASSGASGGSAPRSRRARPCRRRRRSAALAQALDETVVRHWRSPSVTLDILPGCRPAGVGTLRLRQVAEASQGRFPQPLSMWSGTRPAPRASLATASAVK